MSNEQDDRWYVQFDSQEVRLMTLDELDDAFQKGLVHDETYVIPVGGSDWQTLGEILGGDDDGEAQEQPAAASASPLTAAPAVPAPAASPFVPAHAPAPVAAAPASQLAPVSTWPPVAVAPSQSARSAPLTSNPPSMQSMLPVVQDVVASVDDVDASGFKPKKTKLALVGAVALAAIGGIGVAIARLDAPPDAHLNAPAAAVAAVEPPTASRKEASFASAPDPAPAPAPAPVAAAPSEEKKEEATDASTNKLSEDMKKALLAQDKERADKKKSRTASKAGVTRRASTGSKSGPFKGGGNVHDPLNSNL